MDSREYESKHFDKRVISPVSTRLRSGQTVMAYGNDVDGCTPWESANKIDMLGPQWEKYDRQHERFVLDWDDTCKDSGRFWIQAHREVLKHFGFSEAETTDNAILSLFGNIHVGNTLGIERFVKDNKRYNDKEVWGVIKARAKELLADNPMDPLLIVALRRAKEMGVNFAVWSSSPGEILAEAIEMNKIGDIFDAVISVDDVDSDKHKPHPQGLLMAVRAMDIRQGYLSDGEDYSEAKPLRMNGVWMIGDSPNDVLAGKTAGVSTAWLEHPLQGHNAYEKRKETIERLRSTGSAVLKDALESLRPTATIRTFDPEQAGLSRSTSLADMPTETVRQLTTVNINFAKFLVDKGMRAMLYRWEKVREALDEQGISFVDSPDNLATIFYGESISEARHVPAHPVIIEKDIQRAVQSLQRIEAKRLEGAFL